MLLLAALASQPCLSIYKTYSDSSSSHHQHKNMEKTHVVVIPYPAQGHVIPLMEFAQRLVTHGVKVTFVNTDFIHKLVTDTWSQKDCFGHLMQMVSIPDGVEPWEDRNDLGKQSQAIFRTMPAKLEQLINTINKEDDRKVTCVIADNCMGWAIHVAEKMRIRTATFWPASAVTLASMISFQKLIDDGVINECGVPLNDNMIRLSPTMPPIRSSNLSWACVGDADTTKCLFEVTVEAVKAATMTEWVLCNSSPHLESAAFSHLPHLLPIGPLLASNRLGEQAGHFWQEDSTCLEWLDQQPVCSVMYIAFGSFTIFDQTQFEELALGLELINKPFLWVVRTGITKETSVSYPDGYLKRVGSRGRIVSWAPQQKVLAHPSVACFLSHCGWNSTLEGVNNGVPFMCWPYFADQFLNQTYICDIWETGLAFNKNKGGIITREEIKSKANQLLSHTTFKEKALALKDKAMSGIRKGGSSHKNLSNFMEWIQEKDTNGAYDKFGL